VTLVTQQETLEQMFRTTVSSELFKRYRETMSAAGLEEAARMRKTALESTEEELDFAAEKWFAAQQLRIERLGSLAANLNDQARNVALFKRKSTGRAVALSVSLSAGVIIASALLAWILASALTRSVAHLTSAAQRIGAGDLDVRVPIKTRDEFGTLGTAFNEMVSELGQARAELGEKARMGRELEIAATIQRSLLPPEPKHADFAFAGRMKPADEVGGDFYDVLTSDGDPRMWLTMGDVSNHGLGAGLVMLMTQAAFSSHFRADSTAAPDQVFRSVNRFLHENIVDRLHDNKYVTAQLLSYQGNGRFVCAGGHEWPIVYRARTGKCETVECPGPWLGILPTLDDVQLTELELEPGDVLCLYSDGLTEAVDEEGRMFDLPRLEQLLADAMSEFDSSLDRVADQVMDTVNEFAAERRDDDWTLLLVRRQPQVAAA
jgi:sigma-B regulation protein RsbU (phosphoserine phosphatase)